MRAAGQGIFNEIVFNAAQEENAAEGLPKDDFDADAVSNQVWRHGSSPNVALQ